tara:strand:+ start:1242 stop:1385 length:144 start_codon:yes stop_codon:yes gene_type:complete
MQKKLAPNWWDVGLNTITGFKVPEKPYAKKSISDEVKYYDTLPYLEL